MVSRKSHHELRGQEWIVSGPGGRILATWLEAIRAQTIIRLPTAPTGILPGKSNNQVRSFEIGLFQKLRALRKPGVTITALRHGPRIVKVAHFDELRFDQIGAFSN